MRLLVAAPRIVLDISAVPGGEEPLHALRFLSDLDHLYLLPCEIPADVADDGVDAVICGADVGWVGDVADLDGHARRLPAFDKLMLRGRSGWRREDYDFGERWLGLYHAVGDVLANVAGSPNYKDIEASGTAIVAPPGAPVFYQDYLFNIIECLANLGNIKTIFLGDIRSYELHKEFLVRRALYFAREDVFLEEFDGIMENVLKGEPELLVDPAVFASLPERTSAVSHVEILPKKMKATDELSSYRYAAVLHVGCRGEQANSHSVLAHDIGDNEWIQCRSILQGALGTIVWARRVIILRMLGRGFADLSMPPL
ncbi:Enniatin synthase-like protein [Hapsidospora chrysogenum ATCC 11550]|uniref:Enniatin synthase-like protein n=1 Tax=Hapsidospora chrysogenum (strain ATCC 11550 / CBS 779.69 / DSM 880 / IAM 14645 / JCM 23072 / IMI 49137) TaxID=857340 RepID=A0A086TBV8_HAPC1|nr:Enniatin synthase-like protein [Hapsidospora chrysogenum ATCC 11550]